MSRRFPVVISDSEWERLADVPSMRAPTGVRNRAALYAMRWAGLRSQEIVNLAPRDIIRSGPQPALRIRRGKNNRDRLVGIHSETLLALDAWTQRRPKSPWFFCTLEGGQMSTRYLRQMVARCATKAEVYKLTDDNEERPISPHVLRHTYATGLLNHPLGDLVKVQLALGHASIATTRIYTHVSDAQLTEFLSSAAAPVTDSVDDDSDPRRKFSLWFNEEVQKLEEARRRGERIG